MSDKRFVIAAMSVLCLGLSVRGLYQLNRLPAALPRGKLSPLSPASLAPLITQLGARSWRTRERASQLLARLGPEARPVLRLVSKQTASLEVGARIKALLEIKPEADCPVEMLNNKFLQLVTTELVIGPFTLQIDQPMGFLFWETEVKLVRVNVPWPGK